MRSTIEIIADICEDMNGNGYASTPRVVDLNDFDFVKHKAQESGIDGITTEFVYQSGPGIGGDDFQGSIGYPIEGKMLVIDFAT
jgi:hypothetical protein